MNKEGYDNTDRGALFKQQKARETDRDYAGSLNVGGTDYWVSAWVKVSKTKGTKFLSLNIKPKAPPAESKKPEFNDSVPF
jgi:hypothetical protein